MFSSSNKLLFYLFMGLGPPEGLRKASQGSLKGKAIQGASEGYIGNPAKDIMGNDGKAH